jgi:hypothetical protein
VTLVLLVGPSAMAAAVGAGALGDLADEEVGSGSSWDAPGPVDKVGSGKTVSRLGVQSSARLTIHSRSLESGASWGGRKRGGGDASTSRAGKDGGRFAFLDDVP